MIEDKDGGDALTADEQAFFESGGETELAQPQETADGEGQEGLQAEAEGLDGEKQGQPRGEDGKFAKTVPHQAFHAEREEHKKTKAELQEIREWKARMEERARYAEELRQRETKPADDPYSQIPDDDPVAKAEFAFNKLRQMEQETAQQRAEREQEEQREQAFQSIATQLSSMYDAETAEDPSLAEAYEATWNSYDQELQLLGYQGPNLQAAKQQLLRNFMISAAQYVDARRGTIGDYVRSVAQTRGWAKKAPEPGQAVLTDKLAGIAAAQDASRTIGQGSGRAGGEELSAEAIGNMPQSEFEAWLAVPVNAARFKRMMGG